MRAGIKPGIGPASHSVCVIALRGLGLDDDGDRFSYCGGIGEGSHWLMANQARWNPGQTSYTHRPQSVRSQMPHTGQHTHQGTGRGTEEWGDAFKNMQVNACMCTRTNRDHHLIFLKGREAKWSQRKSLFYTIISRKFAGPRKCLLNKTLSCRRERVSVCMTDWGRAWAIWRREVDFVNALAEQRHLENITGTPASMCWGREGKCWGREGRWREVTPHSPRKSAPGLRKAAIIIPVMWAQALVWHVTMKYHANAIRQINSRIFKLNRTQASIQARWWNCSLLFCKHVNSALLSTGRHAEVHP